MRWVVIVFVVIAAVFALSVVLSPKDDTPPAGGRPGQTTTPTPSLSGPMLIAAGTGLKVLSASSQKLSVEVKARVRNPDERPVHIERLRFDVYYWSEPSYWVYFGSTDVPVNMQVQGNSDSQITISVDTHSADAAAQIYEAIQRGPLRLRAGGAVQGTVAGQTGQTSVLYEAEVTLPSP